MYVISIQVIMSVGNLSTFGEFLSHFKPKYLSAIAMATCVGMKGVLIAWFCVNKQNREVSAKSVTMRATALCKD